MGAADSGPALASTKRLSLLIAISRVGLGLHYVSDVLAGAALGYAFALVSLYWMG